MRRRSRDNARYDGPYDRAYGWSGASGGHGRYNAGQGRYSTPFPGGAGYPSARWGWGPIGWAGWGPGMEHWPYADVPGYGFDGPSPSQRRRPEESPAYGRGGDRALRRWASRYGYDFGYAISPRRGGR